MEEYIKDIFDFVYDFNDKILGYITTKATIEPNFLSNNIFNGTLLNINLTYEQLMYYLVPTIIAVLIIYLFIKFIAKLFSLFTN